MNKKLLLGIGGLLMFIFLFLFIVDGNFVKKKENIVIGMKGGAYYPYIIKIKAGVPVEISLDDSVKGCFRDFVIPELGVRKYMKTSDDTIDITFEKGEYTFSCSMHMGQGKIVVE